MDRVLEPMNFSIHVLPPTQLSPDGQRLGQITVGEFTEQFACHSTTSTVDQMETTWQSQLRALVAGKPAVLMHAPRFAWVIYRDGDDCFIQQIFSLDGTFRNIFPRRVLNDDGHEISEWPTTVADISDFLARCYNSGTDKI